MGRRYPTRCRKKDIAMRSLNLAAPIRLRPCAIPFNEALENKSDSSQFLELPVECTCLAAQSFSRVAIGAQTMAKLWRHFARAAEEVRQSSTCPSVGIM